MTPVESILFCFFVVIGSSLGGYPPFSDEIKKHSLHEQIVKGIYSFPKEYWKAISPEGS